MNIFYKTDADGKCFVYDGKGQKYLLDLIHVTFNTENNTIKVLPIECNSIMPEIKTEKNDRKQIA